MTNQSVIELRSLAKSKGIKYFSRMNKKRLCKELDIALINRPNRIYLEEVNTGEVLEFVSLCSASSIIGVNPGSTHYYLRKGSPMPVRGKSYMVRWL